MGDRVTAVSGGDPELTCLDNSSESVAQLFADEYDNMLRLAFVLTRSQHDAEEVVQEGFLDVQQRWPSLLNPGGYLRTAVVNGSRRRMARSANRRQIVDRRLAPLQHNDDGNGEPLYLLDVLDKLPERSRTAIILAYYLEMSSAEIAEVLDCRPGTAKSLVHRGLKRLRRELTQ